MKIIEKDILTVEKGIICQQVNCKGKMYSGVAKSLREKWPIIFHRYSKLCKTHNSDNLLGVVDPVLVEVKNGELWIANLFCQDGYGYDGKKYTDYTAWDKALKELFSLTSMGHLPKEVYFPFFCGCNRGGGDWTIVSKMIEYYFPDAIICKLP